MAKAKVLKDKQGNTIYPVTDASLILGLKEIRAMREESGKEGK